MKFKMTCCCGASWELSAWGVRDVSDAEPWVQTHTYCAVAWQRERGLVTHVKKDEERAAEKREEASA